LPERLALLGRVLDGEIQTPDMETLEPSARGTLEVFRALADARSRYGRVALGPYIVSMSHSAADALAVLALAKLADADDGLPTAPIDVAPLFETVADLDAAPHVLRALLKDPRYRRHVAARGDRQMVMLGYSDSSKDASMMASRWALQQAQIALVAAGREFGVRIEFFHGRGGTVSRGGGNTVRGVLAAPRGSVDGMLRVTEQGEVIHRKYGIRALALRNLEQMSGAVLRATLRPRPPEAREAIWRERMREMAEVSRDHYRALVHEDADFPDYFRLATPIDLIERLRLGSRPPKRAGAAGIGSLRAIPWVFAWSLNRAGLTGWYGAGTGLAHGIAQWGREAMAEMTQDWAFFGTFIDDIEMMLAKCDIAIFEHYSRLSGDSLHAAFHPRIAAEFTRTVESVKTLRGADELLSGDRRLRQSIRLRNPYVDPISLLQLRLLQRWRANGREEDDDYRALVATVNGVSAGVQNTG
jgi:phosphoenolpyruvate carboxylase